MNFELFYGTGGHCGPYQDMEIAVKTAVTLLQGSRSERSISVHPRTSDGTGGYGKKVVRVFKHSDIDNKVTLRFDPPQEWTVEEFMKRFEPLEPVKPEPQSVVDRIESHRKGSIDWFVSGVRVEIAAKVHALQLELISLRMIGTTVSHERCMVIRGEIAGLQAGESLMVDVMRSRT